MFNKDIYRARRERLKQDVASGLIVLPGNVESSMNYKDNHYQFRQDSNFLYFAGINRPDLHLMMDCDSGEEVLFGDDLTIDDIVWTGPQPTIAELADAAGITGMAPLKEVGTQFSRAISQGRTIHITPPYRPDQKIQLASWSGWSMESLDSKSSEKLIRAIVQQRSIKSEQEIEEINTAVTTTAKMHLTAMQSVKAGMRESDISGLIHGIALAEGGDLSFPIILTRNGQTLHNHYHGNILEEGDMVLCDAGAQTPMGYAGDMTRTFPVNPNFSTRQRDVYEVVLNAHKKAVASLKPGVRFLDVHLIACAVLTDGLKQLGLMKGDTDDAVREGAHTMFFQCGLGHMMGLDVHDMENLGEQNVGYDENLIKGTEFGLKSLRLGRELQKGFVLTVEPGVYIIPELIDLRKSQGKYKDFVDYNKLEEFRDFGGIRVEEDFAITADGARLLGNEVAKEIADVEKVRQDALT